MKASLCLSLFVNGTLMRGLDLHANLLGSPLLRETWTAPKYRLYSIGSIHPGMFEVAVDGVAVAGELYDVSARALAYVLAKEPPGLYVGAVELDDGSVVPGVLCSEELARRHRDISAFGDWRAYLAARGRTEVGS